MADTRKQPVIGYPSVRAAVVALRVEQGLTPEQIAAIVGRTSLNVRVVLAKERHRRRVAGESVGELDTIALRPSVLLPAGRGDLQYARSRAATRGITVDELVRRVVEAVIQDRLVDATLDDADELRRAS